MPQDFTLRTYVRRRTGVPLGGRGSLTAMFRRSFGAPSLAGFWRHWNPIWSYGLGRYIHSPLNRVLPQSWALVVTFMVSGLIHDLVIMALRGEPAFIFTPWFALAAVGALAGDRFGWTFERYPLPVRATLIAMYLGTTLLLALALSAFV